MAICDLCHKHSDIGAMTTLRDIYQIDGMKDICPDCQKWADKELNELRARIAPELRKRIAERRLTPTQEPQRRRFNWVGWP